MGLKTLTKLLNTRVLSPFYIREMKPGRGERDEVGRVVERERETVYGRERAVKKVKGKWKKGKRTSIETRGRTSKAGGKRGTNANVNAEKRRYRKCMFIVRTGTGQATKIAGTGIEWG